MTPSNADKAPTIRLQRISIANFKSVEFGEIVFSGPNSFPSHSTTPCITGLYGQNGSGKSSFISAMRIVKVLMSGWRLGDKYRGQEIIRQGAERASIEAVFEQQTAGQDSATLYTYSFDLVRDSENTEEQGSSIFVANEKLYKSVRSLSGALIEKTHRIFDEEAAAAKAKDGVLASLIANPRLMKHVWERPVPPPGKIILGGWRCEEDYRSYLCKSLFPAGVYNIPYYSLRKYSLLFSQLYHVVINRFMWHDDEFYNSEYRMDLDRHPNDKIATFSSRFVQQEAFLENIPNLVKYAQDNLFIIDSSLFRDKGKEYLPLYFVDEAYSVYRVYRDKGLTRGSIRFIENEIEALNCVLNALLPGLTLEIGNCEKEFELVYRDGFPPTKEEMEFLDHFVHEPYDDPVKSLFEEGPLSPEPLVSENDKYYFTSRAVEYGWVSHPEERARKFVPDSEDGFPISVSFDRESDNSTLVLNPNPIVHFELFTRRGDSRIRLVDESDGIQRIVSALSIFLYAFNNSGVTAIIDEFDAGVFEFLLGELLQIFEEEGKGQFIFTSHNLRPLEVLSKKCIWFTTSNPMNRYTRLKYLGKTNNLRDVYIRQILLGGQDDPIYDSAKRYQIAAAMKKARPNSTEPSNDGAKETQNPEEA